jgi:uncharacterized protein YbcC (UPF0753/DUF2309 family)
MTNRASQHPPVEISEEAAMLLNYVERATHLLPSQGPLAVFVHHNTLHTFEDLPFDEGVRRGSEVYGCQPYLAERRYRIKMAADRIRAEDIDATLAEELGQDGGGVAGLSSPFEIRSARLASEIPAGSASELLWIVAETGALRQFGEEVTSENATELVQAAKQWAQQAADADEAVAMVGALDSSLDDVGDVLKRFDLSRRSTWSRATWDAFTLESTWALCRSQSERFSKPRVPELTSTTLRHRDFLFASTGEDADELVNEVLIPFCAAFLDQGMAQWQLPGREEGFLQSFIRTYGRSAAGVPSWRRSLPQQLCSLADGASGGGGVLGSIADSLDLLGVGAGQRGDFILQSLMALRGWAGMAWQMESNAGWALHPAPSGTLVEFLCVRLILDRLALAHIAGKSEGRGRSLRELWDAGREGDAHATGNGPVESLAYTTFRLAQRLCWPLPRLSSLTQAEWDILLTEIEAFDDLERRRVLHLAFERRYRETALQAIAAHASQAEPAPAGQIASFQIMCCIDEREESFRRAIEEIDPSCETFGIAGFFGVAMYYRGAAEAHFRPLCPVMMTPQHSVRERPTQDHAESNRRRMAGHRYVGRLSHRLHLETRAIWGGLFTGLIGAAAAIPLVARILFPRFVANVRRVLGRFASPTLTELQLDRDERVSADAPTPIGYTVDEMANIVEGGLRAMGLTPERGFSPVIVVCGHGSSSLNNPHESAHDCGACGGGRGGPNARAFAEMANNPRVRGVVARRGLAIAPEVRFVAAYHNTCDDSVAWFDLESLPSQNRASFEHARHVIDAARRRNAHERCRRFESAPLSLDDAAALRHVEARSEDLSQTRPEFGHATNVLCLVGRRQWSRGLFLDRRAFLVSYDPTQDDEQGTVLERLLQAVVPVSVGINLEYFFSYVDPTGYGCGTKLPHNISCLLGVMDGARSDLRSGLPWQMLEIHEAIRLQFVIETTPAILERIFADNPEIDQLVRGGWMHVASLDPDDRALYRYRDGAFSRQVTVGSSLPTVAASVEWYRGRRDHLGFASIVPGGR